MKNATINRHSIFNVSLKGQQRHIKDRLYEGVDLNNLMYIIDNNIASDYLRANDYPDKIEIPCESQMLNSMYHISIELI